MLPGDSFGGACCAAGLPAGALPVGVSGGAGVGQRDNGQVHAVQIRDGSPVDLGHLDGDANAYPFGENSQGAVVGSSDSDGFRLHATLFYHGKVYAIGRLVDAPGWLFRTATGIDDNFQITGEALDNGSRHFYAITPLFPLSHMQQVLQQTPDGTTPPPEPFPSTIGGWPTVIGPPAPYYAIVKLHYDYILGDPAGVFSTWAPDPEAVQAVVNAFAAHGIWLQVDPQHNVIPFTKVLSWRDPQPECEGSTYQGSFDSSGGEIGGGYAANAFKIEQHYFAPPDPFGATLSDPTAGVHYMLFGYDSGADVDAHGTHAGACPASVYSGQPQNGQSGMAVLDVTGQNPRGLGYNSIISLGQVISVIKIFRNPNRSMVIVDGATLMHELGHNLGLHHGGCTLPLGPYSCDDTTFKPNYLSVMNYNYQFSGILHADVPGSTIPDLSLTQVDYSEFSMPALDEVYDGVSHFGLNETTGLPGPPGDTSLFFYNDACGSSDIGALNTPVDYDCDGNTTGTNLQVDLNVNDHPLIAPVYETLTGSNSDWAVIHQHIAP
jgi:hypothetical protein